MRKYYGSSFARQLASDFQPQGDLHWKAIEALVQSFGTDKLGDSFYACALEVIRERNVQSYLHTLPSFLAEPSQLYGSDSERLRFAAQYQVVSFLKKFPFDKSEYDVDRRQVALNKLLDCEKRCSETNKRLSSTEAPSWVRRARQLISDVLGDLTTDVIMKIITSGKHGPGATLSNKGVKTTPYYKFTVFPYTVTKSARLYAYAAMSSSVLWVDILERSGRRKEIPPITGPQYQKELMLFDSCVEVVDADHITFVPKDARTDRPIAVGASLNLFLQLGVMSYMEERLRLVGVDITDQSRNQRLAREGSLYSGTADLSNENQFSTIDLASASDTISTGLVELLLDPLWYAFLDDLRHKSGEIDGQSFVYQKFCAMGNGFTFPLETLIFWAVSKAAIEDAGGICRKADIGVYGDDIIIRAKHSNVVVAALSYAGFEVNSAKSFLRGPFKESCGHDYLHGELIRPFFLKRRLDSEEAIYTVCNFIATMCVERRGNAGVRAVYNCLVSAIPRARRCYAPLGADSDMALLVPFHSLSGLGLRPFLSRSEKLSLYYAGLLSESCIESNLPVTWRRYRAPVSYRGREYGRYAMVQFGLEGKVSQDTGCGGSITRRKSTRVVVKADVVPNWDYVGRSIDVRLHPFWDLGYV
nr:MAG: hypothetical protein 3 [Leviviridae sp.]